jgi:hypothetical protein
LLTLPGMASNSQSFCHRLPSTWDYRYVPPLPAFFSEKLKRLSELNYLFLLFSRAKDITNEYTVIAIKVKL